jgi:hypothetical protein
MTTHLNSKLPLSLRQNTDLATQRSKIRSLNDAFRTTFVGGVLLITPGIDALPPDLKARVLKKVRDFNDFDVGNDPHQEHDFGAFELSNRKFFFKIDYYDRSMEFGSPDPTDPAVTVRALTVMLAEEY